MTNLVLSGTLDDRLVSTVAALARPTTIDAISDSAVRLEDITVAAESIPLISSTCAEQEVDLAYIPAGFRLNKARLLAMDMDSTLINIECIDEIAVYAGVGREVAEVTKSAMQGRMDFRTSLLQRVQLLNGVSDDVLKEIYEQRLQVSPGAHELLDAAKRSNVHCILLSGGFTYFAERLQEQLGLHAVHANRLELRDGHLTGRLAGPIVDGKSKADYLHAAMEEVGCRRSEVIVVGDGVNDIPMMRCADHSVSYHGTPRVVEAARHSVVYGTLRTVLDYFS